MAMLETLVGVGVTAAVSALGVAIGSHIHYGTRLSVVETRTEMTLAWLERVEGKLDRALENAQTHHPRDHRRDTNQSPRR